MGRPWLLHVGLGAPPAEVLTGSWSTRLAVGPVHWTAVGNKVASVGPFGALVPRGQM